MSSANVAAFKAYLLTHDPRFHPETMQKQAELEHDFEVRKWKHKFATLAGSLGAAPGQLPPPAQFPPMDQRIPPTQQQPQKPGKAPSLLSEMDQASEEKPTYDFSKGSSTSRKPAAVAPNSHKVASLGYADGYQKTARGGHPNNVAFARMLRPGMFPGLDENRGMKFTFSGNYNEASQKAFEDSFQMHPDTHEYLYGTQKRAATNGPAHVVESTQEAEIEQDGEAHGVAIKEQEIETEPKMEGNEKTASTREWWFNHI